MVVEQRYLRRRDLDIIINAIGLGTWDNHVYIDGIKDECPNLESHEGHCSDLLLHIKTACGKG